MLLTPKEKNKAIEEQTEPVDMDDEYFAEKMADALKEVETYMWGQSAHAVLFCALTFSSSDFFIISRI